MRSSISRGPISTSTPRRGRIVRAILSGAAGMGVLAGAAGCSFVGQTGSAELTVTYRGDDGSETTQQVVLGDLTCRTSSVNRTIVSESVTQAGKEVFSLMAPTDDRETYALAVWFDGHWFATTAAFDASASTIDLDAVPGFVSESTDGDRSSGETTEATIDGTVTCG